MIMCAYDVLHKVRIIKRHLAPDTLLSTLLEDEPCEPVLHGENEPNAIHSVDTVTQITQLLLCFCYNNL